MASIRGSSIFTGVLNLGASKVAIGSPDSMRGMAVSQSIGGVASSVDGISKGVQSLYDSQHQAAQTKDDKMAGLFQSDQQEYNDAVSSSQSDLRDATQMRQGSADKNPSVMTSVISRLGQ